MLSQELTFRGTPTDVQTARAYIDRFDQIYPGVHARRLAWVEECHQNGFVRYLTGRRRTLRGVNWGSRRSVHKVETVLSNNLVQGAAQDFLKSAIVRADPSCINPDRELPKRVNLSKSHAAFLEKTAKKVEKIRQMVKLTKTEWLLQVHDECIWSTEYSAGEEMLNMLADLMVTWHYFPLTDSKSVPLVVEGGVGESWKEAKSKQPLWHTKKQGTVE